MKLRYTLWDCLANLLLWFFLLVFAFPIVLLFFIWKLIVIITAKLFYSDLHPVTPNDTYFAIDDTKGIPIVNAAQIWKVKGLLSVPDFRRLFYKCFLSDEDCRRRYRNFYCYLVRFGGYVFKKSVKEIDLEQHIVEQWLEPGTSLEAWITKWFVKEKFRPNAPLWEIVILHVPFSCKEEDSCDTVLLYKNHHILADGYGFIHILDKLTGNTSPYMVKLEHESFSDMVRDAFFFPKALIDYYKDVIRTGDIYYPIRNPDRKWYMGLSSLDLTALKDIRRRTNTHFITVMMSLMIGALRRLMVEKMHEEDIPDNIYTANSLPWPNHPRTTLVNHWTGGVFRLPFKTSDAYERLQEADRFYRYFHDTGMHRMVRRMIIPGTWCIPSFLMRLARSYNLHYFRYSNNFASLMLSDEPHYLLGHKVEHIYLPLGLTDGVPCCVLFGVSSSHSGKIDLSILANSEIVTNQEDIDRLTQVYFPMEIEDLMKGLDEANNNEFTVVDCS